jgi:hypothetical protein
VFVFDMRIGHRPSRKHVWWGASRGRSQGLPLLWRSQVQPTAAALGHLFCCSFLHAYPYRIFLFSSGVFARNTTRRGVTTNSQECGAIKRHPTSCPLAGNQTTSSGAVASLRGSELLSPGNDVSVASRAWVYNSAVSRYVGLVKRQSSLHGSRFSFLEGT